MRPLSVAVALLLTVAASSRAQGLRIHFSPESEPFAEAAREYQSLWEAEGSRIIAAMEHASGLKFPEQEIEAVVYEGISRSGSVGSPMSMRASYPVATKKATLIHELGHRLQSPLFRQQDEEHGPLFLWLYDVWVALYGKEFADAQVLVEKRRRGPYQRAWDEALALSPGERAKRWRAVVANQRRMRNED
jgi:hypothetical protein